MTGSNKSRQHYDNPANQDVVTDRLAFYDSASPRVDIHQEEVNLLQRQGRLESNGDDTGPVVLDSGSGKGIMLPKLVESGFQGTYVGLDISHNQLSRGVRQLLFATTNFILAQGTSECLPLEDESVDIIFDNLTGYHKGKEERARTYDEQERVAKANAILFHSTSGIFNKSMTRTQEAFVGEYCDDAEPPDPIQLKFTSEKAYVELRRRFVGWHFTTLVQQGIVVIDSEARADSVVQSIRTVKDQYSPEPEDEPFEAALAIVKASLMQSIADGQPRIDNVHRTIEVISREDLGLPDRIVLGE